MSEVEKAEVELQTYLDKPFWEALVDDCIAKSKAIYRYDGSTRLDPQTVRDKILVPLIGYTIFDIRRVLDGVDIEDEFLDDLNKVTQQGLNRDTLDFLALTSEQIDFVEKYKADIGSWLKIAFKKYVVPSSKNIRGFCRANS